jgi:hypothetical protein
MFSRERVIQHMEKCSESYIVRSDPRRFLSQFELFEKVSGSDNISVSIEVKRTEVKQGVECFRTDFAFAN